MKNINGIIKKTIAVIPFVLCVMFFMTGCKDQLNLYEQENKPVPKGKGVFSLRIINSNTQGRTIMPVLDNTENVLYKLIFKHTSGNSEKDVIKKLDSEAIKEDIHVDIGTYTMTMFLYINDNYYDADMPAASGRMIDAAGNLRVIEIIGGEKVTGDVNLVAYGAEDGEGTFSWDITYPDDLIEMKMTVEDLSSNPLPAKTFNFLTETGNSMTLPAGYYRVIFTLKKDEITNEVVWRQTLHVYTNMDSFYKYEFTNKHFMTLGYTITFVNNNGTPNDEESYFYNENVVKPANPVLANHTFMGWYADAAFETEWNGFGSPLNSDKTIYAKFLPNFTAAQIRIGIEVDVNPNGGADLGNIIEAYIETTIAGPFNYQWKRVVNNIEYDIPASLGGNNSTLQIVPELIALGGNVILTVGRDGYYGTLNSNFPVGGIKINVILGSADNPFRVQTATQLGRAGTGWVDPNNSNIVWSRDAHYLQIAHITAPAWTPVGTETAPFTGSYNGGGYEIRNLTINNFGTDNRAMFGYIGSGGTVENIILTNASINGKDNVSAIAAINHGTIQNCVVSNGSIQGTNNVGGITGENYGIIKNSYSTGSVFSNGINTGGITGLNNGLTELCYSTATVTGNNYVGGIAGRNNGSILNSIALNPNITSSNTQIGKVAGSVSSIAGGSTGNKARTDLEPRIRENQGNTLLGDDGANVNLSTSLASVFPSNIWVGWNVPANNLLVGQPLPRLTQTVPAYTTNNPVPTLPQGRLRNVSDNAQFAAFDVRDFIQFNLNPGSPGWFLRPVEGEWVLGGMIEGAESGVVQMPDTVQNHISLTNAHNISAINQQIGNIGRLILETSGNGNGKRYHWRFIFSMPLKDATFTIKYSNGQSYSAGLNGNEIYLYQVAGTHFPTGSINATIELIIETMGNWIYVPPEETPEPFVLFKSRDVLSVDEYIYYFREDGVSAASGQ